jgi:NitT/TauT family transport system substrate-binding protein
MQRGRIWVLAFALILEAACTLAAPQAQPGGSEGSPTVAPLKLSVGWGVTPISAAPTSVLWLAKDLGLYAAEGLDVDLEQIQGTPNVITGMRTGQIDVGELTAYEAVSLTATDSLSLKMIGAAGAAGQENTFMVVSRDTLGSLEDLRGKTFAVSRTGSFDDSLAKQFLRARGIDPAGVQFLALGDPNLRVQAMLAKQVDATMTSVGTWVSIRQQPGLKILSTFDEVNAAVPTWPSGNVVTAEVAQQKAEQLRRFTRAIIKASRLFASNKQAWVEAMGRQRSDMDPVDLGELWDLYTHSWGVNGGLNLNEYETGADLLYSTSPDFAQVPRIGVSAWSDTEFVDAALRDVGVDPAMDDPGRAL